MPLPTSGPISLSMIRAEFGGTAPDSLSEYYAGGANVPAGTSGTNGPVPSSGPISFSNFYGTQKVVLSVALNDNYFASSATGAEAPAVARFQLGSDGAVRMTVFDNTLQFSMNWLTAGSASSVEVLASIVGDPPTYEASVGGSATGTWLNLGTTREWTVTRVQNGQHGQLLSITLRRASDGAVLDSTAVEIFAERAIN